MQINQLKLEILNYLILIQLFQLFLNLKLTTELVGIIKYMYL